MCSNSTVKAYWYAHTISLAPASSIRTPNNSPPKKIIIIINNASNKNKL